MLKFVFLALMMTTISCTTPISKEECRDGDWNAKGFQDASHGISQKAFEDHAKTCEKQGYRVDRELYERGYAKGLESFCTYQRGFKYGLEKRPNPQNCPPELAGEFNKGFDMGVQQLQYEKEEDLDAKRRRQEEQKRLDKSIRDDDNE